MQIPYLTQGYPHHDLCSYILLLQSARTWQPMYLLDLEAQLVGNQPQKAVSTTVGCRPEPYQRVEQRVNRRDAGTWHLLPAIMTLFFTLALSQQGTSLSDTRALAHACIFSLLFSSRWLCRSKGLSPCLIYASLSLFFTQSLLSPASVC